MRRQHVHPVVAALVSRCEDRRSLRRAERQQEGLGRRIGGGPRRGDGVRELDHGVEVDERVMVRPFDQVGRERQLEPEHARRPAPRRDRLGREDAGEPLQRLRCRFGGEPAGDVSGGRPARAS
jgi:hypothetical protein